MDVVITGSTKGLGLAMAKQFLRAGDRVTISSRTQQRVDTVAADLQEVHGDRVFGTTVDVTEYETVEKFGNAVVERWDNIDIWINNAGTTAYEINYLHEQSADDMARIVDTNLLGTMYGCKVAIQLKAAHVFNLDGLGANGRTQPGYTIYGTTKRAIPYLTESLVKETADLPVGVHTLSPGMVLTDLLVTNTSPSSRKIFNILAERPSVVANYLVPRVRSLSSTKKSGEYIKYLTKWRVMWRFLTFWRYSNRFFDNEGELVVDVEGLTSE